MYVKKTTAKTVRRFLDYETQNNCSQGIKRKTK